MHVCFCSPLQGLETHGWSRPYPTEAAMLVALKARPEAPLHPCEVKLIDMGGVFHECCTLCGCRAFELDHFPPENPANHGIGAPEGGIDDEDDYEDVPKDVSTLESVNELLTAAFRAGRNQREQEYIAQADVLDQEHRRVAGGLAGESPDDAIEEGYEGAEDEALNDVQNAIDKVHDMLGACGITPAPEAVASLVRDVMRRRYHIERQMVAVLGVENHPLLPKLQAFGLVEEGDRHVLDVYAVVRLATRAEKHGITAKAATLTEAASTEAPRDGGPAVKQARSKVNEALDKIAEFQEKRRARDRMIAKLDVQLCVAATHLERNPEGFEAAMREAERFGAEADLVGTVSLIQLLAVKLSNAQALPCKHEEDASGHCSKCGTTRAPTVA